MQPMYGLSTNLVRRQVCVDNNHSVWSVLLNMLLRADHGSFHTACHHKQSTLAAQMCSLCCVSECSVAHSFSLTQQLYSTFINNQKPT